MGPGEFLGGGDEFIDVFPAVLAGDRVFIHQSLAQPGLVDNSLNELLQKFNDGGGRQSDD